MQNYGKWLGASAIALAALSTVAGCTDKNNNGEPDSAASPAQVDKSASNMVGGASNEVKGATNAVSSAGNTVAAATSNTVKTVGGALKTSEIKAKIINNASLNNPKNQINVDSDAKSVTLKGHVQNASQKALAASIAKQNAGGRNVVNQLTVAGGASATATKKP